MIETDKVIQLIRQLGSLDRNGRYGYLEKMPRAEQQERPDGGEIQVPEWREEGRIFG